MYSYLAYGIGIRSDVRLPDLIEQEAAPDVVIRLGKAEPLQPTHPGTRFCQQFKPGDAYFYYYKMGRCRVRDGREITGEPLLDIDLNMLGLLAQGPGISFLLHQRGCLTLHASCVNLGSAAIAFLGESGAGKSFMAAALQLRGHVVVADDVTIVEVDGSASSVYPGFPGLQLLPDAAKQFGCTVNEPERLDPFEDKVTWRFPGEFTQHPVPLRRLYFLEDGPSVRIDTVSRHRAVFELVRHSYWIRLMHDARPASYFLQCAKLCEIVPVLRLIRPRSASAMPELIRAVEEDLLQGASPSERLRKP
jgi:hypothetical protein